MLGKRKQFLWTTEGSTGEFMIGRVNSTLIFLCLEALETSEPEEAKFLALARYYRASK